MLLGPCTWVIAVEPKWESLEPFGHLFDVVGSILCADGAFDDGEAGLEKLISPVAILPVNLKGRGVWHVG